MLDNVQRLVSVCHQMYSGLDHRLRLVSLYNEMTCSMLDRNLCLFVSSDVRLEIDVFVSSDVRLEINVFVSSDDK